MERFDEGIIKWGALASAVIVLECVGTESLTHAFQRAAEHPVGKYVALGALGLTAAHLLDKIPHQADPYYMIANGVGRLLNANVDV